MKTLTGLTVLVILAVSTVCYGPTPTAAFQIISVDENAGVPGVVTSVQGAILISLTPSLVVGPFGIPNVGGQGWSASGVVTQHIIPALGASFLVNDFTIANVVAAPIHGQILFASDEYFPSLVPRPAAVFMDGIFTKRDSAVQAGLAFNVGAGNATPFSIVTIPIPSNLLLPPFDFFALSFGVAPAGTFQLGGGIDFMLPPGGSVTFPIGLADNIDLPVPEPSTILLLGSGLAGLAGIAWRKGRNK